MKAKSLKKPSDEEKIRLKKSKSSIRKCSYSSDSSDSGRKKPRKLKKSKKKSRKRPRQPSISPTSLSYSSDYSVSSCSTCEKRKAGTGKSKIRKGRASTGTKYTGRERGRSHRRSRSCSTCSDRSRNPSRSRRHRNGREKEERAQISRREDSDIVSSKDKESNIPRGEKESESVADASEKVVPEKALEKVVPEKVSEKVVPEKASENVVPEKVQNDDMKKTGVVVDAEMILRQRALENFIKFHKVKKCGISEERGVPVSNESIEEVGSVPGTVDTDKEREESILDEPSEVITDIELKGKDEIVPVSVKRPKLRSVIVIPSEREGTEDNTTIDTYNTSEVSNGTKDESSKGFEPNPKPNPSSSVVSGLRKDEEAVQQQETTSGGVDTGGAQYKKKTFSRMHDGETVQSDGHWTKFGLILGRSRSIRVKIRAYSFKIHLDKVCTNLDADRMAVTGQWKEFGAMPIGPSPIPD